MLVPGHAGKDYSKVLDTCRDSNESFIAVEVMTRPVLLSRRHFLPVTESIAGGRDRLKKISRISDGCYRGCKLRRSQISACAGANDPAQNEIRRSLVLQRAQSEAGSSRPSDRWHPDETLVLIAGERVHLYRVLDHEREVLDLLVQRRRNWSRSMRSGDSIYTRQYARGFLTVS